VNITVQLSPDPSKLPEGMSPEHLAQLLADPFYAACVAALGSIAPGVKRTALAAATAPVLLHEALHHVGVGADAIDHYAVHVIAGVVNLQAHWVRPPTTHFSQVSFQVSFR